MRPARTPGPKRIAHHVLGGKTAGGQNLEAPMSIVLGYVPTSGGAVALELAAQQAILRQTTLIVVNIAIGNNFADVTFADEKELDEVAQRLTHLGVTHEIRQIIDATDVAGEILAQAETENAELIVVGLRRSSPLGIVLLGSNAQRIILTAPCPVLSIRPKAA
jgi:nucleotide-binding universal stress UspA family protein